MKYGLYLVCHGHILEVKTFLQEVFKVTEDEYAHKEWITFVIPSSDFVVNLMKGNDQALTQNITIELYCNSFRELEYFANKFHMNITSFESQKALQKYIYHYIELSGPHNICKVEINYSKDSET